MMNMTNLNELVKAIANGEASTNAKWKLISDKTQSYIDDYGYLEALAGASCKGRHVWIEKLVSLPESAKTHSLKTYIGKYIITIRQYSEVHAYVTDEI